MDVLHRPLTQSSTGIAIVIRYYYSNIIISLFSL